MTHIQKHVQSGLIAMVFVLAVPQLAAAQSSASLADLFACETIAETQSQLACFRTETAKLRAAETAGEIVALEKEEVAEFKTLKAEKEIKTAKSRTLAIHSTERVGRNDYIQFTLENGEIWQQTEDKYVRLGRGDPDRLTVTKASLGSFRARVNEKGSAFRIKRVK